MLSQKTYGTKSRDENICLLNIVDILAHIPLY